MKITPLEIRQKNFEKVFRGYDKDEVHAFLNTLSHEWEKTMDECKESRIKLESSQKEVEKLRQVETSLFKTLKTAEDTGANLIDQANKTAELHVKESRMKAEKIISDAENKAQRILEEAEKSKKEILEEMMDGLKDLRDDYKRIAGLKENLLRELYNISSDTVEKVEKFKNSLSFDVDNHFSRAKETARQLRGINSQTVNEERQPSPEEPHSEPSEAVTREVEENQEHNAANEKANRSFFDEI